MAFLGVAINDDVMACNPLVVVPSILKVPVEYTIHVLLVGGVFGIRWVGDASRRAGWPGVVHHLDVDDVSVLRPACLLGFHQHLSLTVTMRVLGVLYVTKKHTLGW
jgi:hypothetical protein